MAFTLFSEKLQKLIKEKGFIEPTLPQRIGIPEIMKGSNVLILAPTGQGKTESVFLPLIDMISRNKNEPIAALYISPLRALNRDLLTRLFWWADKMDLTIDVRHGDTTQKERAAQRENPPNFLVVTPETLQALLPSKIFRNHLRNVKHVIVDEIHEIVGSKRGVQLSLALERLQHIAGEFQRIGLSATIGEPEKVAEFLGKNTKIIRAEAEKKYNIKVESPKPGLQDTALSEKLFTGPETTARLRRLHELINEHTSVLCFTNTRETAEVLSSRLRTLDKKLQQTVHHGSLAKEGRIKSEQQFKKQELKSLIATSSLELGIDIGSVDLVVQYLSPRQAARLIQRVGRAGHKSGLVSKGIIITGDEDVFESTIIAKMAAEKILEPIRIHEGALDVLANQIIGMAMDEYQNIDKKMYNIIKNSYAFRNLTKKEFDDMLNFLKELYMLWINELPDGTREVKRARKCFEYYFSNLTMIPDKSNYRVVSVIEHEPVGTLDEAFVAEHGLPGNKFIFAGRAWRIIQIDKDKVMVEPSNDIESAIPSWEGELMPVPYEVAQGVGRLRRQAMTKKEDHISEEYNIDKNSASIIKDIVKNHSATHTLPDDKTVLVEDYKDFVVIHIAGGSLTNDTIGRYLSAKLTTETGTAVNMKSDPYRIMLQTMAKKEKILEFLKEANDLEEQLMSALERSTIFKYRFIQVAKRFGVISRHAKFDQMNINRMITAYAKSPIYKETVRELMTDKMDLVKARETLDAIAQGKIKIMSETGLSYLGELGLVHKFREVMKPRMPDSEIFEAFKKRLLSTKVKLVCMNCRQYAKILRVGEIEDQPECTQCTSRLIAVMNKRQDRMGLIKKKFAKKKLTKEEEKELISIRRTADLSIVYGNRAAIALAGRGVGPQTATRILAKRHTDRDKFLKDILTAEKEFVRTKIYWK
ncbi:MAG: DEAD/DEAH box helicase [Candidatus Aenigmarchaeota archaeon]|nr:DEAD/DEAH box helicase [Candidatus Aenigmarchaeota archaeon]